MDPQTLELFRSLQVGPYDDLGLTQLRKQLVPQRRALSASADLATLGEIVELLASWAQAAGPGRIAAGALGEAADIAERELADIARATALRDRAVALARSGDAPASTAPRTSAAAPGAREIQTSTASALDREIDECERALNDSPDIAIVQRLAALFVKRDQAGDRAQAADLFFTVGDVLGETAGLPMLERALELAPTHREAKALRDKYVVAAAVARSTGLGSAVGPSSRSANKRSLASRASGRKSAPTTRGANPTNAAADGGGRIARTIAANVSAPQSVPQLRSAAAFARAPQAAGHGASAPGMRKARPPLISVQQRSAAPAADVSAQPATSLSPVVFDDAVEPIAEQPARRARKYWIAAGAVVTGAAAAFALSTFILPAFDSGHVKTAGAAMTRGANTPPAQVANLPEQTPSAAVSGSIKPSDSLPPNPTAPANPATPASDAPASAPTPALDPSATKPADEIPTASPVVAPTAANSATAANGNDELVGRASAAVKADTKAESTGGNVHVLLDQVTQRGGKLSDAQLSAAFEKAGPKLERCYDQILETKPHTRGRLIITWTVRLNGRVADAKKLSGTIKDATLAQCTVQAIADTRFPKPHKQAVKLKLPLEYRRS
jgi:hypothetical protein